MKAKNSVAVVDEFPTLCGPNTTICFSGSSSINTSSFDIVSSTGSGG